MLALKSKYYLTWVEHKTHVGLGFMHIIKAIKIGLYSRDSARNYFLFNSIIELREKFRKKYFEIIGEI